MDGWGLRRLFPHLSGTALNLYGPPGTGKTLCAEALAYELGRPLLVADYAEIESKYVGDTPKNIVRCFEQAEHAEAVLFFDEADLILGSRLSSVSQSADHGVNVSEYPTASDVDLDDLAARAAGLTGADIANALLGAAGVAIDRADEKRSWARRT